MDAEICEVVVTLTAPYAERTADAVAAMSAIGFTVGEIIEDEGVVGGTIERTNFAKLEALDSTSFVRTTLCYFANFPTGDPRDRDGTSSSEPVDPR